MCPSIFSSNWILLLSLYPFKCKYTVFSILIVSIVIIQLLSLLLINTDYLEYIVVKLSTINFLKNSIDFITLIPKKNSKKSLDFNRL